MTEILVKFTDLNVHVHVHTHMPNDEELRAQIRGVTASLKQQTEKLKSVIETTKKGMEPKHEHRSQSTSDRRVKS